MTFYNRCVQCYAEFSDYMNNARLCPECCEARTTELRALYREAYFAALGGFTRTNYVTEDVVLTSRKIALETVRQWPSMMDELYDLR